MTFASHSVCYDFISEAASEKAHRDRAAPASAAHRIAPASAAQSPRRPSRIGSLPRGAAAAFGRLDGFGASAAINFDYWDTVPGFSFCGTTVRVV